MAYRIDESIIQNFLTHHTRPLRLSTLAQDALECPICQLPYAAQDAAYNHPTLLPDTPEYPVQIRKCRHTLGRRCVERHIRAGQPWSHTCPMCRAQLFPAPNTGRTEVVGQIELSLNALARVDRSDGDVRREVEEAEQALARAREVLYGTRWI